MSCLLVLCVFDPSGGGHNLYLYVSMSLVGVGTGTAIGCKVLIRSIPYFRVRKVGMLLVETTRLKWGLVDDPTHSETVRGSYRIEEGDRS